MAREQHDLHHGHEEKRDRRQDRQVPHGSFHVQLPGTTPV
jgi:hypothetical protein